MINWSFWRPPSAPLRPLDSNERRLVYVAGPLRSRNPLRWMLNHLRAWYAARVIWGWGHVALCPHANTFAMGLPIPFLPPLWGEDFIAGDLDLIGRAADALFFLPGWDRSHGALEEKAHAQTYEPRTIVRRYTWRCLRDWLDSTVLTERNSAKGNLKDGPPLT